MKILVVLHRLNFHKILTRDKHSSLFWATVSDEEKSFKTMSSEWHFLIKTDYPLAGQMGTKIIGNVDRKSKKV